MIYWYCGPNRYKNSGIGKYSGLYISCLKEKLSIKDIWIPLNPKSFLRVIYQFLILPIHAIVFSSSTKIFYDEGWLPILFFPIKNSIFIIHDIRDDTFTKEKLTFVEKVYISFMKKSIEKLNSFQVIKIITVSDFTKQKLINLGIESKKIEVIYNSFDLKQFQMHISDRNELKKALFHKYNISSEFLEKKILLNIGSEENRKNIMTILKTLSHTKDYIFIKIGAPIIQENRKKHIEFIHNHNLPVFFINQLNNDELIKFYKIADIYLTPSLFEGFGRTPIEAQASSIPVISSDKGALREVLDNSVLYLENPLDDRELEKSIYKIEKDLDLKQKIVTNGLVNSMRFSLDKNLPNWERILITK